jgi:hypothetical protein
MSDSFGVSKDVVAAAQQAGSAERELVPSELSIVFVYFVSAKFTIF